MGAISQTNINCVGSHAGISIGEDGPSQMALEDLAMFRSIPGIDEPLSNFKEMPHYLYEFPRIHRFLSK